MSDIAQLEKCLRWTWKERSGQAKHLRLARNCQVAARVGRASRRTDAAPLMTAPVNRLPVEKVQYVKDRDLLPNRCVIEPAHELLPRDSAAFSEVFGLALAFSSAR